MIKRCPFCGEEVELKRTGLRYWKFVIAHTKYSECILRAGLTIAKDTEAEAEDAWNQRAEETK